MAEPPPRRGQDPEIVEDGAPPGPPRYGWFGGVLEGRVGDAAALRRAFEELDRATAIPCDLEVEGGRFSLLFSEATVDGGALSVERQDQLLEALGKLLERSADPRAAESTLRGSLVFGDEVVETLFTIREGRLAPVSRRRPLSHRDPAAAARRDGRLGGLDAPFRDVARGRGVVLLVLILAGGGLTAWRSGYLGLVHDAVTAPSADEVEVSAGVFGETLSLEIERRFTDYSCEVRRGAGYPANAEEASALVADATTTGERAAMSAVSDGESIWIRVVDEEGSTLSAERIDLRPLLDEEEGPVEAKIRARARGVRVELALSRGRSRGDASGDEDAEERGG
ncbi:MAG: hypothetical protein VX460_02990 [Planctomycetota bacterium]|nr:hypothetical protein [Planctomycetota bacterium]